MENNPQTPEPGISVIATEFLNFVVLTRRRFISKLNPGGSGDPAERRGCHNPGGRSFQGSLHFRALSLHVKKRFKYTMFSALGLEEMSVAQETKYYETSVQSKGFILVKYNQQDQSSPESTSRKRSLYVSSTHVEHVFLTEITGTLSPLKQHTTFPHK